MFTIAEVLKATEGVLVNGARIGMVKGVSTDTRSLHRGDLFIALKGPTFDAHDFLHRAIAAGAAALIVERISLPAARKIPVPVIRVADSVKALGALAAFHRRRFAIPVIAVTGSTGKTTTKELLAWVLGGQGRVLKNEGTKNNHIGVPLTLLRLTREYNSAILELGSNHAGEIAYLAEMVRPQVGVITNIGPAHLEFFKTLTGVYKEKYSLIQRLMPPAVAVMNADDPRLRAKGAPRTFTVTYGMKGGADFLATGVARGAQSLSFRVNRSCRITLATAAGHNIANALAAVAVARMFGMSYETIARRLKSFAFPRGRFTVSKKRGVWWVDDTYNANPASVAQALQALREMKVAGRRIFVMGDMRELGARARAYHAEAGRQAAASCDVMIAVGALSAAAAARASRGAQGAACAVMTCRTAQEAKALLRDQVRPRQGDAVLVKGSRAMKMEEVLAL